MSFFAGMPSLSDAIEHQIPKPPVKPPVKAEPKPEKPEPKPEKPEPEKPEPAPAPKKDSEKSESKKKQSPVMAKLWREAKAKGLKGYQHMKRSELEIALN